MKTQLFAAILLNLSACAADLGMHRDPPLVVGERTNHQGHVTQRLIRETSYTSRTVPLTPDGPQERIKYQIKYFIDELGKPRRELPIMEQIEFRNVERYLPLENSGFWVGVGLDPIGNKDTLHFVFFDGTNIVRKRTFNVTPKWQSSESEYEFQYGNRIMTTRVPGGFAKYDVLTDTTTKVGLDGTMQ